MIYFVTTPDRSRIKIGTTIRLSHRLKQLAAEHGDLEILAVTEGDRDIEQGLHRRFAHLNVVNEWFEPGDDLLGFIAVEGKPWDGKDEKRKVDIRLRMDASLAAAIQAAAESDGTTVAGFIRATMLKELRRRAKEKDATA